MMDSAFVVFGAAHLAFAVDTISQEFPIRLHCTVYVNTDPTEKKMNS